MKHRELALFGLHSGRACAERVAQKLGTRLAEHEEREFEFGHHKSRPLESVRGRDVYVIQSLHGDEDQSVNDKLCRLLFFLGALVDASAAHVTAVVPFLCYSRKERRTQPRDPVTTRYVAQMFEALGTDRVVTLEVHSLAAFQNSFRCRTEHLGAHEVFAEHFAARLAGRPVTVVSPDVGGVKRAARYRAALERRLGRSVGSAFMEKYRSEDVVSGETLVGEVAGRTAILVDDMICGGTTLARAAEACRRNGAADVFAAAAHGAFTPKASAVLATAPIRAVAVLDHIPPFALDPALVESKLEILEGAGLLAECIRRLHAGESLAELGAG
jgi:ribose-phosphate pyrophosphokinase